MGQAKRRGTYEERCACAVERARTQQAERDRLDDLRDVEHAKHRPPPSPLGLVGCGNKSNGIGLVAAMIAMSLGNRTPRTRW